MAPAQIDDMQIREAFHMLCPSSLSWNPLLIHTHTHTSGFSYLALGHSMTSCIDWGEVRLMRSPGLSGQTLSSHRLWGSQLRRCLYLAKLRLRQMNLVAYCGESWTPFPALPSHFTYVCPPRLLAWTWSLLHTHTGQLIHPGGNH